MENKDFIVVVLLGVNGSGKTTIANELAKPCNLNIPLINMDLIGRRPFSSVEDYNQMMAERMQIARAMMDEKLINRQGFITELTLSTIKDLDFLKHVKQTSATLVTIFVLTRNIEINISRISNRVNNGGHNVPTEKVERRYPRHLANMPLAIDESDISFVYDNSRWYKNILIKAEPGKVHVMGADPDKDDWIKDNIKSGLEKTNEVILSQSFTPNDNNGLVGKLYKCLSGILENLALGI